MSSSVPREIETLLLGGVAEYATIIFPLSLFLLFFSLEIFLTIQKDNSNRFLSMFLFNVHLSQENQSAIGRQIPQKLGINII